MSLHTNWEEPAAGPGHAESRVRKCGVQCRPASLFADAQLDNVLLSGRDPQLVKLCDFGYSKDGDLESACKTTCGTPEYMAPEVRTDPQPLP